MLAHHGEQRDTLEEDQDGTATCNDFQECYADLRNLLIRFKTELLAEQRQQLERGLENFGVVNQPHHQPLEQECAPQHSSPQTAKAGRCRRGSNASRMSRASRASRNSKKSSDQTSISFFPRSEGHYMSDELGNCDTFASAASGPALASKPSRFTTDEIQNSTCLTRASTAQRRSRLSNGHSSTHSLISTFRVIRQRLQVVILGPYFDCICGAVICLNTILLGVETEVLAQRRESYEIFDTSQMLLNVWYIAEIGLRMLALKRTFWTGEDAQWNLFDSILVVSALVDVFLYHARMSTVKSARILRVIRLFRIVRTLRLLRHVKQVREFRKMVCSLTSSVTTLFWSMLLVCSVMYCFALWFTQTAAYLPIDNEHLDADIAAKIHKHYSSLGRTFYTLFAAISGGYSWHVVLDPWLALGDYRFTVCLFFVYIFVTVFGLLNIVTSVFVESAMHATKHFQDLLLDEKRKELEMYTRHMKRIFNVIDADGGGTISFREMELFLEDETSQLKHYFEALGITSSDVWVLFKLLDTDDSGAIYMNEFCDGCMRLKGEARSFDVCSMMYESRAMVKHTADFMDFVEDRLAEMETRQAQLLIDLDSRFGSRLTSMERKICTSNSVELARGRLDDMSPKIQCVTPRSPRSPLLTPDGSRTVKPSARNDSSFVLC